MRRLALVFASILYTISTVHGDIRFSGPDLSQDDVLLFTAEASLPGGDSFRTLFRADLDSGALRQLTFYPERISLLDRGRRLQVQNRFGLFRTGAGFRGMEPLQGFPSFVRGSPVRFGKLPGVQASPDGMRLLHLEAESPAFGRLILLDLASGKEAIIATGVPLSADRVPALWSPDSRHFVYSRDGNLYYYSLDQHDENSVPDEPFRRIGPGRIENAQWNEDGGLLVLRNRNLYRILPAEFFAHAFYAGVVSIGTMVGRIPIPFDPNFDTFRVSPDGRELLLCKDARYLFLHGLSPGRIGRQDRVVALPY
ncbi:MAG TPA: hypothetical protein VLH39_01900, partial [Magnetospirillaceae bacterium]|nr:hypothetical protein [Magnetospirillaceae bacterium]